MNNCTKCTINEIVKEHMCEQCYTTHNEWLANAPEIEQDGYTTVYTSS